MEIRYLKEFVVLADLMSYTKAADELYISQPVLSKHIKSLEKELDADLFRRGPRSIVLTEFGQLYLPYAKQIVGQYEEAERKRNDYIEGKRNIVHFGVVEDLHLYEFREYMSAFASLYPSYKFRLTESFSSNNSELFEQGAYNIFATAFAYGKEPESGFIPIAQGDIKALIRKDHPLVSHDRIWISDLAGETIVLPRGTVYLSFIEPVLNELLPVNQSSLYSSYSAAKAQVEADSFVALLHQEALKDDFSDQLVIMDLEPQIRYTRGLIYRNSHLNDAEKAFVDFAKEYSDLRFTENR